MICKKAPTNKDLGIALIPLARPIPQLIPLSNIPASDEDGLRARLIPLSWIPVAEVDDTPRAKLIPLSWIPASP